MVQSLGKRVRLFITKLNIVSLCGWTITLLGIYPSDLQTYIYPKSCIWMLLAALFINAHIWKQSRYPLTDDYVYKLLVCPHHGIRFSDNKCMNYQASQKHLWIWNSEWKKTAWKGCKYYIISFRWYSGKDKTVEWVTGSMVAWGWGKQFCKGKGLLKWWECFICYCRGGCMTPHIYRSL